MSSCGHVLAVLIGYYALGRLNLIWPLLPAYAGFVWLPSCIALPALLRWGLSMWPAIAAASWLLALAARVSIMAAVAEAASHTAGPVVAAWLLQRWGMTPHLTGDRTSGISWWSARRATR